MLMCKLTGSITPVEPGRMRNTWYPRQKAQYMTASMLEGVKPKEVKAERDFTFGVNPKVEETPKPDKKEKKDHPVEVQTKLLPVSFLYTTVIESSPLDKY